MKQLRPPLGKRPLMTVIAVLAALAVTFLLLLAARRSLGRNLAARLSRLAARLAELEERGAPRGVEPSTLLSLRAQCGYLQWGLPRWRESKKVWFFRSAREDVSALEGSLAEVEAGRDPLAGATGVSLRGFSSPVDGDLTVYSLRVPASYDPAGRWPLIIHLHGRGRLQPFSGHPAPDYGGRVIVLSPYGKGSVDYMGPAEADVLAALGEAQRLYSIEADRVYLAGASMGGTGAWHLAAHHPDRFAALVAASANADDRVWEQLWEEKPPRPEAGSPEWALERLERLDSPVTYAGNLLHVPARVVHGEEDAVVPVEHSRSMVRALLSAGAEVEYQELVGIGHNVSYGRCREEYADWLLEHRRASRPQVVRYATDGRWPGAYWVKRLVPEEPLALAEVAAEVAGGRSVEVRTHNASALGLDLAGAPLAPGAEATVTVDGCDLGACPRERVAFLKRAGRWERVERPGAARPREFSLVFWQPFAIVYGTGGDDEKLKAALKREAGRLAGEWRRRYFGSPPLYADAEVPGEVLKSRGLVLFGGPEENSVTGRALEALAAAGRRPPVAFEDGTVRIEGRPAPPGDPETLALQFSWPSPFNPRRSLAVIWGASWRALVDVNGRFGNSFDWTLYENRRWFGCALFDQKSAGPAGFVSVGFFGADGRPHPRFWWARAAGAGRELPGAAPRYQSVGEAPAGRSLFLDELLPAEVHQMRGPVGFGRSWGGRRLSAGRGGREFERGLGVRAPGRLVYELEGRFRRLRATAGADLEGRALEDYSAPRVEYGVMSFRVLGDGKELYFHEGLGPADEAVDIDIDVSGVRRLELEVRPAGKYEWHLGSGAWAEARLER